MHQILKLKLQNKKATFTTLDMYCSTKIIADPQLLELETLREIANFLNVSEATISRYFRKIGFASFSEFKFWKKQITNDQLQQNNLIIDVDRTIKHLQEINFSAFINDLISYNQIYLSGRGESKFLAQMLERKLIKLSLNATFISINDFDMIEYRPYKNQKNFWIIISNTGGSINYYLESERKYIWKNHDLVLLSAQKPQVKYFKYFKYIFYGNPLLEFGFKERFIPLNSEVILSIVINYIIDQLISSHKL